jgi:hypothetical protein
MVLDSEHNIFIYFNSINLKDFFKELNNKLTITIVNLNNIILLINNYTISYDINNYINEKKYFINLARFHVKNLNDLNASNFNIKLPKNYYFFYTYYKNDLKKSIIIYKQYINLPLIYLGLPNLKDIETFIINYKYNMYLNNNNSNNYDCSGNCCDSDCSGNYNGSLTSYNTLFNNYFGNNNYLLNTLELFGNIYEICISNNSGITSNNYDCSGNYDCSDNYKIFKIKNKIEINLNTNIYFYNTSNLSSSIIYLNSYNYIQLKFFPDEYETLITSIQYSDVSGNISYTSILSLNLQTFNPDQLCIEDDNYYNTLFFYNYINKEYDVNSIDIFSYDYEKYFYNTIKTPEYNNIINHDCSGNLYNIIIDSNTNLVIPIILSLNYSYLFINLDLINLVNLINSNFLNQYLYQFTKSTKINLDIIINYLLNFTIKEYNIYKLNNIYDTKFFNINPNILVKSDIIRNNLYNNEIQINKILKNINQNEIININNNIVNRIQCKIIFYFSYNNFYSNNFYSIDTEIFLNNYNLELYHKKYNFNNDSNDPEKKKLINMLLFLATSCYKITLYFYNDNFSVIKKYLFNQVDLFKNTNDYTTNIDVMPLNNDYTNGFLKFNININKEYYILFLDIDAEFPLKNNELIFVYKLFLFKIFKINTPNGNMNESKQILYICFQNLKELNIFMEFIQTGILNIDYNKKLSNYFNIPESITFYNYSELNNYWIVDNLSSSLSPPPPPLLLHFSINNLYINKIYLYGNKKDNVSIKIL